MEVRTALGTDATFGDLYDARIDKFSGRNLFMRNPPPSSILAIDNYKHTNHVIENDSYSEIFTHFFVNPEVKLSVLSGLCPVEKSARCLLDKKQSSKILKLSLVHVEFTKFEELVWQNDDVLKCILLDSVSKGDATHVVVGIYWGANAVVSAECYVNDNTSDENYVRGGIEKLVSNTKGAQGGHDSSDGVYESENENVTVKVFSDLEINSQLRTNNFKNAFRSFRDMPNAIRDSNSGKGKAQSYIMVPLNVVKHHLLKQKLFYANMFKIANYMSISEEVSTMFVDVFDNILSVKRDLKDLNTFLMEFKHCIRPEKLKEIKTIITNFEISEQSLKLALAKSIVAVRSSVTEASALTHLLANYKANKLSADKIRKVVQSYQDEYSKMSIVQILTKGYGVHFMSAKKKDDVKKFVAENMDRNVYILYCNLESIKVDSINSDTNLKLIWKILTDSNDHQTRDTSPGVSVGLVDCENAAASDVDDTNTIHHYEKGILKSTNFLKDVQEMFKYCTAKSTNIVPIETADKPTEKVHLQIKCPGSFKGGHCEKEEKIWCCSECTDPLEYGFDQHFYCSCGRAPDHSYEYRCNDFNHGFNFTSFKSVQTLRNMLLKLKPMTHINILILGETGVGKSTWINGLANYLTYTTFEEAEANELIGLIPSSFTVVDKNFKRHNINTGMDDNEATGSGQSSTQEPRSYIFVKDGYIVRLIDTPGIGDTRGIDQDKKNMENILSVLSYFTEIHGICFLLKPNESRLTVWFKFCMKELLTHLHKDASRNIVFCFTNSRGTLYQPGETFVGLQTLLKDIRGVQIELSRDTVYCMDNESVRYLGAVKYGIEFDAMSRQSFSASWDISVAETNRMMEYIYQLKPHAIQNTLSLNDARRSILELTKPLAEIARNIQTNIAVIADKKQEIQNHRGSVKDLVKTLYIPVVDLEPVILGYPRTVCTASKCVDHITIDGTKKINYKTHCHPHCYLKGVQTDVVNCVALQSCAAMYRSGGKSCHVCGCSWDLHMHITYELKEVNKKVVDQNVLIEIQTKEDAISSVQMLLKTLEKRCEEYRDEEATITKVTSKFAFFLKTYAIAPYNDALNDYLNFLIREEKEKVSFGGDKKVLKQLEEMQQRYIQEKNILEEALKSHSDEEPSITPQHIKQLVESLYHLPYSGPALRGIMDVAAKARDVQIRFQEKNYIPVHPTQKKNKKNKKTSSSRVDGVLEQLSSYWSTMGIGGSSSGNFRKGSK